MKLLNKSTLFLFFFLCLDVLFATGISELWIRLFIPVKNICYYHDPILGDMFCPNQRTYGYVEKGYANIFVNNSLGFHDIERSKEKKKGVLRIHIYGDSMIAGAGVPVDKTIPRLLESNLNKKYSATPVEVFNMASAEDSTGSELLTYQYIGKDFSPDVVICYFMNDFHDNIFETHQRTRSPYFKINSEGSLTYIAPIPVDMSSPWERFKRWSHLYRLMANKFLASKLYHTLDQQLQAFYFLEKKQNKQTKSSTTANAAEIRNNLLKEKAWPLTLKLLLEFKKEVEQTGAQFIIVDDYPITPSTSGGYTNKDFEAFCIKNNIQYIPMYKEYESLRAEKTKYFLLDSHPTILGNENLSQTLAKKLMPVLQLPEKIPD